MAVYIQPHPDTGIALCELQDVMSELQDFNFQDYRSVALTSVVMKLFERLLKSIISSIPSNADLLQFAYCPIRSTEDLHILHTTLSHVDKKQGNYVRSLFVDYSSAFNTILPIDCSQS